ncbi:hypothetical protein [Christiangramia aquimixticola]|uniref:hypothetical protein n=1 Tax=Christiangramia aquimixticola TaxID=1697558 RepID=UPI003AA93417
MDDLDLLKQDWKKQEKNLPHLSYDELYGLIWKRSSSIVRWIFIISLVEFGLATLLNIFLADDEYWSEIKKYDLTEYTIAVYIISYAFTFYFIYRFYRNYRAINSTDSAVVLMKNIIRTRKTVKYYIAYVLISTAVVFMTTIVLMLRQHALTQTGDSDMAFDTTNWILFIGGILLILIVLLGLIWLIYRLVYGILLRRLNKNYKELKKLEME